MYEKKYLKTIEFIYCKAIMRVTIDHKSYHTIEDIIQRFGKELLICGVDKGLYKFEITETNKSLQDKGFFGGGIIGALKALRAGRPIHHVVKSSGRIKKNYHGVTFRVIVENMDVEQSFLNRCELLIACEYFMNSFKKHVKKKFMGVEAREDPITCDKIVLPVYLKNDWELGSKIIYDYFTVTGFARYKEVPQVILVDPDTGVETMIYKKEFMGFFSPYTNKEFDYLDVRPVPSAFFS